MPLEIQVISTKKHLKAWTCPKCNDDNLLTDSKLIEKAHENPHFTKVLPEPPTRKQSASDRTTYYIKYKSWYGNVRAELTRQFSKLRWDNWKRGEQDNMDVDELKEAIQDLEEKY